MLAYITVYQVLTTRGVDLKLQTGYLVRPPQEVNRIEISEVQLHDTKEACTSVFKRGNSWLVTGYKSIGNQHLL
jgi:hypothetical protein